MLVFFTLLQAKLANFLASKWFIRLYCLIYFVIILTVSFLRWKQFEFYYFDHGIFDQSLWKVAHFQPPLIEHYEENGFLNQLADHFTPVMYLLAPMYLFTDSYVPLIILQNVFIVASAWVMWQLARKLKLPIWTSAALLVAYTWFVGLQNTVIAGFHTEMPALLTLAATFYCLETKKWRYFWLFLALTLGLKETFASIAVAIGIYLFLKKSWQKGLLIIVGSVIYFLAVTRWFMPAMSGLEYGYSRDGLSAVEMIRNLYTPSLKLSTLFYSFLTFGFLPLFDWQTWALFGQDFFWRFVLGTGTFAWDFGFHYSAMSAILLYFCALKGAQLLVKHTWYKRLAWVHAGFIILAVVAVHYKHHGSLGLFFNRAFYQQTASNQFLEDFVAAVPTTGLVMTQNNLAVRFTHIQGNVMLLHDNYWKWFPDVIAIDTREGQNPNNYWPINPQELYDRLINDPNYTQHKITNQQIYFAKNSENMEYYYQMGWEKRPAGSENNLK